MTPLLFDCHNHLGVDLFFYLNGYSPYAQDLPTLVTEGRHCGIGRWVVFPMIANLEGKMVVGQFGSFIYGFKAAYDGTIEEGDMFLTTDPYTCNGAVSHSNDWLLLRPIFKDGRLIAYASDKDGHGRMERR